MDDVIEVQVFEADQNAGDEEFSFHFFESSPAPHVVPEISSHEKVHNEIKVLPVLERIRHVYNKGVLELR